MILRPARALTDLDYTRAVDGPGQVAVLVADDDPGLRLLCRVNLELEGYRVLEAASAAEVNEALERDDVRAVLLDVHLGPDDGLQVARTLRESHPDVGVAIFTGSVERSATLNQFADGFLSKPFTLDALSATVRELVRP